MVILPLPTETIRGPSGNPISLKSIVVVLPS
jgi:hypothetical protein